VLEKIEEGTSKYHAIENMACPGGCINGGGNPLCTATTARLKLG
jgi:iron only hydrogenase large subunit-like protein